ncbi:MAG: hypothetical protein U0K87_13925 [Ruminococcus sp.]|nr:hypothetical protein [Ruminococcus sp.]
MLSYEVTYNDKSTSALENVISAELDREIGVPADSMRLVCEFDPRLRNADMIRAFSGDRVVFEGQLDEIITEQKIGCMIMRLNFRNIAAALLDNEAEPVMYVNPSAEMIFTRHLKPFGVKDYRADSPTLLGTLRIVKGMTHWQVFENYCRNAFGEPPGIDSNGTAWFGGLKKSKTVYFGGNGFRYYSLKEKIERCKLISAVRVKLSDSPRYTGLIENKSRAAENITRVRLVDAVADKSNIQTADRIIAAGNRAAHSIELRCTGCQTELLGCKVELDDKLLGIQKNLTISKLKYLFDSKSERTHILLRAESSE